MSPDAPAVEGKEDMVQMFVQMSGLVKSELTKLDEQQKAKEDADVDYVGVFTDFAT